MKILRSKGLSYSEAGKSGHASGKLARGLALKGENALTPSEFRDELRVVPEKLADFVGEDYALVLRQTVSVLDKVIRKPGSLRKFALQTYVDRTFLSEALWQELCRRCEAGIRSLDNGDEAFQIFRETWLWKVHPYAKNTCDFKKPSEDLNADVIKKHGDENVSRTDAQGRWHSVFWILNARGEPDYAQIATKIISHLFVQELDLSGAVRTEFNKISKQRTPTKKGLIQTRGESMVNSASDPRKQQRPERQMDPQTQFANAYFNEGVARQIFDDVCQQAADIRNKKSKSKSVDRRASGKILYDHFGAFKGRFDDAEVAKKQLWPIHNNVRQHYQKVFKSNRFREAFRQASSEKTDASAASEILRKVLPDSCQRLRNTVVSRDRNAEISRQIRLGKMIIHASRIAEVDDSLQDRFNARMDYFATSEGQSEIKRNETFARIFRNAVGMSLRTLNGWVGQEAIKEADGMLRGEVQGQGTRGKPQKANEDIASEKLARQICTNLDQDAFKGHLPLIFGEKVFKLKSEPEAVKVSRSGIFTVGQNDLAAELMWAMLRLGGRMRNCFNHFNVKGQIVQLLTSGMLAPNEEPGVFIKSHDGEKVRQGNDVHGDIVGCFNNLLRFDLLIETRVIADRLEQIDARHYLNDIHLEQLCGQLSPANSSIDALFPNFTSVIKRRHNLETKFPSERSTADTSFAGITPFATLDISEPGLTTPGPNFFRVGVLRLLYENGFRSWLSAALENDEDLLSSTVRSVIDAHKKRVKEYDEAEYRKYADTILDSLALSDAADIEDLFNTLFSLSAKQEREHQSYRQDRDKQKQRSDSLVLFKLDLFGAFLSQYIKHEKLDWIWNVAAQIDEECDLDDIAEKSIKPPVFHQKPWHAEFYAWLYLLPNDDASLLRHQIRKTLVLMGKSEEEVAPDDLIVLNDLDRLMALYLRVSDAGFNGTEHLNRLEQENVFFEDSKHFDLLYADRSSSPDDDTALMIETDQLNYPGTRRGLRQILRFADLGILRKVIEHHRVEEHEAALLYNKQERLSRARAGAEAVKLHKEIYDLVEKKQSDTNACRELCAAYKGKISEARLYQFCSNAVRLTEYARLHQLLMRIAGRLVDYSLMWERDRKCLYIGMLADQAITEGQNINIVRQGNQIALQVHNDQGNSDEAREAAKCIPVWSINGKFVDSDQLIDTSLLEPDNGEVFSRYFESLSAPNPLDVEANKKLAQSKRDNNNKGPGKIQLQWRKGKKQIRNDFAHFNFLRPKHKPLNLSYSINAIRSLLSYDRKLKNAVSKSIADILHDEGFDIQWDMRMNRLYDAEIIPDVEHHLAKVKADGCSFVMPKASPRYTSMVKALFSADNGGEWELIRIGDDQKRKGALNYPEKFKRQYGDAIPECLRKVTCPELGSDFK